MKARIHDWLSQQALPLWISQGVDRKSGGFTDALAWDGSPIAGPKRSMVQARQIYSFRMMAELGFLPAPVARDLIQHGTRFLLGPASRTDASFYSRVSDNREDRSGRDLYAQAFALFGLAQAYAVLGEATIQRRAFALVDYLESTRRLPEGGYSEIHEADSSYEANPHMHLFEAALAWMECDSHPRWRALANEIAALGVRSFYRPEATCLAEHFGEGWQPQLSDGRFLFEPGHHCEWAWLLGRWQKLTGQDTREIRRALFASSEAWGLCPTRGTLFEEVWSDGTVKNSDSRLWPVAERVKVGLQLATESDADEKAAYWKSADQAMETLFTFLNTPLPGAWYDRQRADGTFDKESIKASSLYHIVGAFREYLLAR